MKVHSNPPYWFTEQLNSHFPSFSTPSLCHALSPFSFRSVIGGAVVQVSAECYKEHGPPSRSAEPGLPVSGFVFLPGF